MTLGRTKMTPEEARVRRNTLRNARRKAGTEKHVRPRRNGHDIVDQELHINAKFLESSVPHYLGFALKRAGVPMSAAMLEELTYIGRAFKSLIQRINKLEKRAP